MQAISFRQLASNFSYLTAGEATSKLFTFAAFSMLARVLGPGNFGYLEFTLAIMVFFTLLVDFGSSPYGAREVAKDPTRIAELSTTVVALRTIFALAGYLLLILGVFFLPQEQAPAKRLIFLYGLTLFAIPGFLQWIFQGLDRMKWVALGSVIRQSIFVTGVFLLIHRADQLFVVPWIEFAAVTGFVAFNLAVFRSKVGSFSPSIDLKAMKTSARQAMPIGLSELLWAVIWYSGTVFLGLLIGGKAVGLFGSAHRVIIALHSFVWLYFYNLLPSISRSASGPKETLERLMRTSMMTTSWVAAFLVTGGTILAEPLVIAVYGPQYREAATYFKILIWVIAVILISHHYSYTLIGFNLQRLHFLSCACAMVTSLLISILLIPRVGATGVAIAILSAWLVNFALAYFFVRKNIFDIPFLRHLIRPAAAACITTLGFILLSPLSPLLACAVVIILFGIALMILQPGLLLHIRSVRSKEE